MRGFVDLFQRILQLAIRDFQLGQLKDQRIASLQQGIEQFALGAQLRFQNTTLLGGERLSVSLTDLADLRLLVEDLHNEDAERAAAPSPYQAAAVLASLADEPPARVTLRPTG